MPEPEWVTLDVARASACLLGAFVVLILGVELVFRRVER